MTTDITLNIRPVWNKAGHGAISVGPAGPFPQQDDERAAHQEHKPHAVHPGQSGEEELHAEGEDERANAATNAPFAVARL